MANITLNSLVYTGQGLLNGIATYVNLAATGVASTFNKLTGKVTLPYKGSPYSTVKWRLTLPFVKSDPAACPCPGEAPYSDTLVAIDFRFDERLPTAQRDAALQSFKDLALKAEFTASVSGLVQPAG